MSTVNARTVHEAEVERRGFAVEVPEDRRVLSQRFPELLEVIEERSWSAADALERLRTKVGRCDPIVASDAFLQSAILSWVGFGVALADAERREAGDEERDLLPDGFTYLDHKSGRRWMKAGNGWLEVPREAEEVES